MAASSRIRAIKVKAAALIDAHTDLDGVTVTRGGHPGAQLMEREHVWIDRVRFSESSAGFGGAEHKRDQEITVDIFVRVEQYGNDPATLDDRVLFLANGVEEALRANPRLDGEVLFGGVTSGEQESWQEGEGRVSAVQLEVTYRARKVT